MTTSLRYRDVAQLLLGRKHIRKAALFAVVS
jgi:hypothetical protein